MLFSTIITQPLFYHIITEWLSTKDLQSFFFVKKEFQSMICNLSNDYLLTNNDYSFLLFLSKLDENVVFPNIQELDFSNRTNLSVEILLNIFDRCVNLTSIDLNNISIYQNDIEIPLNSILLYLATYKRKLKKLNIWGCIASCFYVENILDKCYELEDLHITQSTINGKISNNFLEVLQYNCPKIKKLCIEKCNGINSKTLCQYLERNKKLQYLNICYCRNLDDSVISTLMNCKNIQTLVIHDSLFGHDKILLLFKNNKNITVEVREDDEDDSTEDTD